MDNGQNLGSRQYTVRILSDEGHKDVTCYGGSSLMDIFRQNNIYIEAPCGGKGICGKCKVRVRNGEVSDMTHLESQFLSHKEKQDGYRLACMTGILGDTEVVMENYLEGAQIMSTGIEYSVDISPQIAKKYIELDVPSVDDQRDDLKRLADALKTEAPEAGIFLIRRLPQVLRDSDFKVTVAYDGNKILDVDKGDTSDKIYGVAIDIGTTTVVCYLMNLITGAQVDVISGLNVQRTYGDDVISRIQYTMENIDGLSRLRQGIGNQISELIHGLARKNHIPIDDIYNVVIAGNTIMSHLLLGITPGHIAAAPFTPVATKAQIYNARDLDLSLGQASRVFVLPHISGYVGSDIVAGILASGMDRSEDVSLMIDIGTNGEIVLGNKDRMVCCSTAAGPAFEGANIRNGMGGISGAINTITLDGEKLRYTTIGDKAPLGICGSGIVDVVAMLLDLGIVDETGRLLDEREIESEVGSKLACRLRKVEDGLSAFTIVDEGSSGTGGSIVITQKDIREVQLAKAAIAAGIKVLVSKIGREMDEIANLYLAGGFGSYIDKRNAIRIGLIPPELQHRIIALGNAAGTGAMLSLLSLAEYERTNTIKAKAEYVELSSTPEFQNEYVDSMYFESP
jgi:uncharacterized 2Fe-2S/4Fe-4S cluster protein (DUF4445 family)